MQLGTIEHAMLHLSVPWYSTLAMIFGYGIDRYTDLEVETRDPS